jgi:cytochrome c oxidase subunit 2
MHKITRETIIFMVIILMGIFLAGCSLVDRYSNPQGTSWGSGVFTSNGERIYFTATSDRGTEIGYKGGPASTGWMMMNGRLTCASCHGPDGRGGLHSMGMMQTMDAPDIRWSTLEDEFDEESFHLSVAEGKDPDGTIMSTDMPRWTMSDADLADLIEYLKTLP